MSLKNIFKKGSIIIVGSALFLTLGQSQKILQTEFIHKPLETSFYHSEMKKQVEQEFLSYDLKLRVLGFEIVNKTMNWNETITEDQGKLEHKLDIFLRASRKYWGNLNMRKITCKDSQDLEGFCEEFFYGLSDGEGVDKGSVKMYLDRAEINYENQLIIKQGRYKGILSFLEDVMREDLKVGERRNMDVLFSKDVYHFKYKVVCEETLYETYVSVQDVNTGEWRDEGRGKSYETYKIELKIRKQGTDDVREGIYFWIGKEGKHKGDVVKLKIKYNWAVTAEMMMRNLF